MLRARMPAALPSRRVLLTAAGLIYIATFVAMLFAEVPGLGLGHFLYVAIALVALAAGPVEGVAAGVGAAGLYSLAIVLNPQVPSREIATAGSGIRLVTFTIVGLLLGWFSRQNRTLVHELQILADRDGLTGLPNTRSFEIAITRRLESERPFALLIGDMDGLQRSGASDVLEGDDAVRRLADVLGNRLGPDDELARVGGDEFAVLTSARTTVEASRTCARLESVLAAEGAGITFGWSVYPQEGLNALSLYRAADERLYARKMMLSKSKGDAVPLRLAGEG
jgi:diguanylate cyclase (GGDEF)-like protein